MKGLEKEDGVERKRERRVQRGDAVGGSACVRDRDQDREVR